MHSSESPLVFQFPTERFMQVCRYAQCSLELPSLFFNALSLLDSKKNSDSFNLLFQFRMLCHEWLCLAKETKELLQSFSLFGRQMSDFCSEEAAVIRKTSITEQCKEGILTEDMRLRLFRMYRQTESQAGESLRFLKEVDDIRRQMENEIQPQAAVFRELLDAQPSLVFKNQWKEFEIPHCDFLRENPVVFGLMRDLRNAASKEETERVWNGLHLTAESLWNEVEEAFSHVGTLDSELIQISANIREWNALWTTTGQYLENMQQTLSTAMDSERLLNVRSRLEHGASQWESFTLTCQDAVAKLTVAEEQK